jgi:hypothetical protein
MAEFKDLIQEVSKNTQIESDVKKETLQMLYDAKGIISLAESQKK